MTKEVASMLEILVTGIVGGGLTFYWHLRQKRRELVLEMEKRFWEIYGESYINWKRWNYLFPEHPQEKFSPDAAARKDLLEHVGSAEAKMEGILLQLICERRLADQEIEAVAKFREAHQQLRHQIHGNKKLGWNSADDPRYLALKTHAAAVLYLISTSDLIARPSPAEMQENM